MAARTKGDRIFDALVAAIEGIDGSAQASSTIAVNASAGAYSITVADGTSFLGAGYHQRKRVIILNQDGGREEVNLVTAVTGNALTLDQALVYDHTLAQADAVKQYWYNHTVTFVRTWARIGGPTEAPLPAGSLMTVSEERVELLSEEYEVLRRRYRAMLIDAVDTMEPDDQANDRKFQRLLADLEHGLMHDVTLGGLVDDLDLVGDRVPLDHEDITDESSEKPLVGAQVEFEVEYKHFIGQLYW